MVVRDLETRVAKLEKALAAFSAELRLAYGYVRPDAASSLTKSRIVLEKLLIEVYTAEMKQPPRKPLLGDMLADNQFTRRIERRIVSRMNAIRDMGNLGPHGERVESSDAARVLEDLCEVLDWYLRQYPGRAAVMSADYDSACADGNGQTESPERRVVDPILLEEEVAEAVVLGKIPAGALSPGGAKKLSAKAQSKSEKRLLLQTSFGRKGCALTITLATFATLLLCVLVPGGSVSVYWLMSDRQPRKFGAIEITSNGVRAIVIQIKRGSEDYDVLCSKEELTDLASTVGNDGLYDEQNLDRTAESVKQFHKIIRTQYRVKPSEILIVGGSGMFPKIKEKKLAEEDIRELREKNKRAVEKYICKPLDAPLTYTEVKEEVKQNFRFLVQKALRGTTLFLDLGSSSSRGATQNPDTGIKTTFEVMGLTEFQKKAKELAKRNGITLSNAARQVADQVVRLELRKKVDEQPAIAQRPRVHLIGGLPWIVATHTNPADRGLILTRVNMSKFQNLAFDIQRLNGLPVLAIPTDVSTELRDQLKKDSDSMKDWPSDKLVAGVELFNTFAQEFRFSQRDVFFHNLGPYTVAIGAIYNEWERRQE